MGRNQGISGVAQVVTSDHLSCPPQVEVGNAKKVLDGGGVSSEPFALSGLRGDPAPFATEKHRLPCFTVESIETN